MNHKAIQDAPPRRKKIPLAREEDDEESRHDPKKTPPRSKETEFWSNAIAKIACINLDRRPDRWETLQRRLQTTLTDDEWKVIQKLLQRHPAVDGNHHDNELSSSSSLIQREWDATNNARYDSHIQPPFDKCMTLGEMGCALSHVQLWQQVVAETQQQQQQLLDDEPSRPWLILEDDVRWYPAHRWKGTTTNDTTTTNTLTFTKLLQTAWNLLEEKDGGTLSSSWDLLYLGFCHACPPAVVVAAASDMVRIVQPQYGFYTHAYAIQSSAAQHLLHQLPITAPLDVWLADHDWFGLRVYCVEVQEPPPPTTATTSSSSSYKKNLQTQERNPTTPAPSRPPRYVSLIAQRRVDSDIVHSAHDHH